jgi:hypothetical protein
MGQNLRKNTPEPSKWDRRHKTMNEPPEVTFLKEYIALQQALEKHGPPPGSIWTDPFFQVLIRILDDTPSEEVDRFPKDQEGQIPWRWQKWVSSPPAGPTKQPD